MRAVAWVFIGFAGWLSGDAPAQAGEAPAIVIPGKPGVPVIINGFDASYTVVEGDWGLDRPGYIHPTIISGPLVIPAPHYYGAYFPAYGRRPGYGRLEVEPPPNRRLPRPAQSYYRAWGAQSDPIPATLDPPAYQPPVIVQPQIELWQRRFRRQP